MFQGGEFNQDGDLYDDVIITASSSEPADTVSSYRVSETSLLSMIR